MNYNERLEKRRKKRDQRMAESWQRMHELARWISGSGTREADPEPEPVKEKQRLRQEILKRVPVPKPAVTAQYRYELKPVDLEDFHPFATTNIYTDDSQICVSLTDGHEGYYYGGIRGFILGQDRNFDQPIQGAIKLEDVEVQGARLQKIMPIGFSEIALVYDRCILILQGKARKSLIYPPQGVGFNKDVTILGTRLIVLTSSGHTYLVRPRIDQQYTLFNWGERSWPATCEGKKGLLLDDQTQGLEGLYLDQIGEVLMAQVGNRVDVYLHSAEGLFLYKDFFSLEQGQLVEFTTDQARRNVVLHIQQGNQQYLKYYGFEVADTGALYPAHHGDCALAAQPKNRQWSVGADTVLCWTGKNLIGLPIVSLAAVAINKQGYWGGDCGNVYIYERLDVKPPEKSARIL